MSRVCETKSSLYTNLEQHSVSNLAGFHGCSLTSNYHWIFNQGHGSFKMALIKAFPVRIHSYIILSCANESACLIVDDPAKAVKDAGPGK